jgi:hypothetical protein
VIPLLAVFTSLLVGALVIIFTAENPLVGLEKVGRGYWGMLDGAVLNRRGITNTMVAMTPLILTGLAVAIPFRAGLFNIGGEGQFTMGALCGTLAGIYLDLPPVRHPRGGDPAGWYGRGHALGVHPGSAQGLAELARGDQHDHVEFHGLSLLPTWSCAS